MSDTFHFRIELIPCCHAEGVVRPGDETLVDTRAIEIRPIWLLLRKATVNHSGHSTQSSSIPAPAQLHRKGAGSWSYSSGVVGHLHGRCARRPNRDGLAGPLLGVVALVKVPPQLVLKVQL